MNLARRSLLICLGVAGLVASCRKEAAQTGGKAAQALWQPGAQVNAARTQHTATMLVTGKVLLTGGAAPTALASAELYDPVTDTWTSAAPMAFKRHLHRATLLPSGKVLVTGGSNGAALPSCELYDPASNTWTAAASMILARVAHTATLLPNGKVLVAGGYGPSGIAELYDPATNTWTAAGVAEARLFATATLLPNGKVLFAGGTVMGAAVATADLYEPAVNAWTSAGNLTTPRQRHTATLLPNGRVLLAGGEGSAAVSSADLYDPGTNAMTAAASMAAARSRHSSAVLANGKVLVTGGTSPLLALTEVYDATSNTWTGAGALAVARFDHSATALPNGKVLVAAGEGAAGVIPWTELYEPTLAGTACSTAATCPLGYCVDGLCCNGACAGPCDSCDLPSSPGVCTNNPARTTGSPSCAPYACSGTSPSCPTSCTVDAECALGNPCVAAVCPVRQPPGAVCSAANQCESGHCVDGRCCDTECGSPCDFCSDAGTCVSSPVGSPGAPSCAPYVCSGTPQCHDFCITDLQCVATHACGAGSTCRLKIANGAACDVDYQCASTHCLGRICCDRFCNGACSTCTAAGAVGTCIRFDAGTEGAPKCWPYLCSGASDSCLRLCDGNEGCAKGWRCSLDGGGVCLQQLKVGFACEEATDCASGNCVDGVCCSTRCNGACDACNLSESVGTCVVSLAGSAGAPSCSPYVCDGSRSCPTSCASDSDCVSTRFCFDGGCVEQKPQGQGCTTSRSCTSNSCSDGVCCNEGCAGPCEVCNVAGSVGTCTLLADGSEGSPTCAPYLCAGTSGKCRGTCTNDSNCAAPNLCSHGFCTTKAIAPMPAARCGCGASGAWAMPLVVLLKGLRRRRPPRQAAA